MLFNQTSAQALTQILSNHGVICYPTEGVWGLGCHPKSEYAFNKIMQIKQRPLEKGVILVASHYEQLLPYAVITSDLREQLSTVWPGFVTCLLPKSRQCPAYLCGQHETIAVRVSAYAPVKALCQLIGSALVSTSANISGQLPVNTLAEAKALFADTVDYYVDQPLGGKTHPSRIIQFADSVIKIVRY